MEPGGTPIEVLTIAGQRLMAEVDVGKHQNKEHFQKQITESSDGSTASTTPSWEELSSPEFFKHQCAEIDALASRIVDEEKIHSAIQAALEDVKFCVTIGDPLTPDSPLIAVSDEFEKITGYSREEVIGKSCRFLNHDCEIDPVDLVCLRSSLVTGASFTSVLTNRRKTGEQFLNLLDLRGLTVAKNPCSGEELWFLVGIQADVSDVDEHVLENHLSDVHQMAHAVRIKLAAELQAMAVAGALRSDFSIAEPAVSPPNAWCLIPAATWRCEDQYAPVTRALVLSQVDKERQAQSPEVRTTAIEALGPAQEEVTRKCEVYCFGGAMTCKKFMRAVGAGANETEDGKTLAAADPSNWHDSACRILSLKTKPLVAYLLFAAASGWTFSRLLLRSRKQ